MKHPPLLFLDTETVGINPAAPIWEIAAVRIEPTGSATHFETLVAHDPGDWLLTLPKLFVDDYKKRYDADQAAHPRVAVERLAKITEGAIVCGSNPSFDIERLERLAYQQQLPEPFGWHYHPFDIPTLAHGYLLGRGIAPAPPWKSDFLSRIVGVDPADFDRHTAMGDCEWTLAMWKAVTGAH